MGNVFKRNDGNVQATPQQGGMNPSYQQQPAIRQQQPQFAQQQQPQFAQQQFAQQPMQYPRPPVPQQQPGMMAPMQQPQYQPQQPTFQQQPQYQPQQQPAQYRPSFPSGAGIPQYSLNQGQFSLPNNQNQSSYENDQFLAHLTGWTVQDIERLRHEYSIYANPYGVIDRDSFRKLYIASLLNITWQELERDSEAAFRNFDINRTGALDFNEYITACSQMSRDIHQSQLQPSQSYSY